MYRAASNGTRSVVLFCGAVLFVYCNYERAIQVPFPICLDKT